MRNVSNKTVDKSKTHILFPVIFFFENRVVYEIMWKNMVQPGRPQMTIWRMRTTCWITKAPPPTHTHTHTYTYTHTHTRTRARARGIGNCFSASTMVTRTRVSITLYEYCLPCYNQAGVYCAVRTGCLNIMHVNFCL